MESTEIEPYVAEIETSAHTPGLMALVDALTQLDQVRADLAKDGNWEALAWGKKNLGEFKKQLATVADNIDADIARLLPSKTVDVDGLGRIEVSRPNKYGDWESDKLLRWLVRRSLVDPETGERREMDVDEAADRIYTEVAECMPVRASTQWRTGALKERGVQLDEWCTKSPGKTNVRITG